jgi:hypothetical protein
MTKILFRIAMILLVTALVYAGLYLALNNNFLLAGGHSGQGGQQSYNGTPPSQITGSNTGHGYALGNGGGDFHEDGEGGGSLTGTLGVIKSMGIIFAFGLVLSGIQTLWGKMHRKNQPKDILARTQTQKSTGAN